MDRRSDLLRFFRNDFHLRQFFLEGVVTTGKSLGVGSYGSVVEVCVKERGKRKGLNVKLCHLSSSRLETSIAVAITKDIKPFAQ